jgi:hypothetical protein
MEEEINRINSEADQLISQYENIISSYDSINEEANTLFSQNDSDETITNLQQLNIKIQDIMNLASGDLYHQLLSLANQIGVLIPKINSGSSMMERISRDSSYQEKQSQKTNRIKQMTVLQKDLRIKANYLFDLRNKLSFLSGQIDRKIKPPQKSESSSEISSSNNQSISNKSSSSGFSTNQRRRIGLGGKKKSRNKRSKKYNRKRTQTKKKKTCSRK